MTTQDNNQLFEQLADLAECFDVLDQLINRELLQGGNFVTLQSVSILFRNLNKQFRAVVDDADSRGLLS